MLCPNHPAAAIMPPSQGPVWQGFSGRVKGSRPQPQRQATRPLLAGLSHSPCFHGRNCESTKLTCSCPMTQRCKVMVKLSVGTNTSSGGSTRVHTLSSLSSKVHLCLMSVTWLLERPCVRIMDAATTGTLYPPRAGLALHPHLVKRSQALDARPSSGADL